jgi:hypothetical protein
MISTLGRCRLAAGRVPGFHPSTGPEKAQAVPLSAALTGLDHVLESLELWNDGRGRVAGHC